MTQPLRETFRNPTEADLAIGRGIPSSKDGRWSVLEVHCDQVTVWYSDGEAVKVSSEAEWQALPSEGLQAVMYVSGWVRKGRDEYRWRDRHPKYGIYLADDEFEAIMERVWRS